MKLRAWFPASLVVAAALGGLVLVSPGSVQAEPGCMPAESAQVTVLARPGLGHSFLKLEGDGDAAPYLDKDSGRVMVPVRSMVTLITPAHDVARWDDASRTATFQRGDHTLSFSFAPGSNRTDTARLGGQIVQAEAYICGGKVVASARFIAGALGSGIKWYKSTNTVVVDPAWGPDSETLALQVTAGASISGSAEALSEGRIGGARATSQPAVHAEGRLGRSSTSSCAAPARVLDYLLSPADSSRQAARSVACQWVVP